MTFKDYYNTLSETEKSEIRDLLIAEKITSYPSFYRKLKEDAWSISEYEMIKRVVKKDFGR